MRKHTRTGNALEALVNQMASFKQSGGDQIYFGALADNPEKEEDCTFGDLIEPAYHELTKLRRVMRVFMKFLSRGQ